MTVTHSDMKVLIDSFCKEVKHLEGFVEYHMMSMDYRISVKDTITSRNYSVSVHSRWDKETTEKAIMSKLEHMQKEIYIERGKYFSEKEPIKTSYKSYPKTMYDYSDYEYEDATSYGDTMAVKKMVKKTTTIAATESDIDTIMAEAEKAQIIRELEKKLKEVEIQAKLTKEKEERKKAYDGNTDFGTF